MTFSSITKMFSSDRTLENGKMNPSFQELDEYDSISLMNRPYLDDHQDILKKGKDELVAYARDTYGLKLHRKMSPSNMVKAIYECVNNREEVSVVSTASDPSKKKAGRPKGSKNKPKEDPLIDNF